MAGCSKTILTFLLLFKISECNHDYIIENSLAKLGQDPVVNIEPGLIRGLQAPDGEYSMFLGIPYATIDPVNPFGPSIPHEGFTKPYEAFKESPVCPQLEDLNHTMVGSLECLCLNIYVPNSADSFNRLPVMVWIHGGGFSVGSAGRYIYGPKYLMTHNVILVTFNYRLGPYGFMCLTDNPKVPGNQGLKDQLTALRWIRKNIQCFGGNPQKVTVFGGSSGGMSVDLHLHSTVEPLFHKAIMQSGTSMLNDLIGEPDDTALMRLANYLGYKTNDLEHALSFVSNLDPRIIIQASFEIELVFKVCVENNHENVEPFLSAYPFKSEVPKANSVPILIGINSNEMMSMYVNKPATYFKNLKIFESKIKSMFHLNYSDSDDESFLELCNIVKHFYIGDEEFGVHYKEAIADFHSDVVFNYPAQKSVEKYLKNEAKNVFFYVFSYSGQRNFMKMKGNFNCTGAVHADELGYLFDLSYYTTETPEDRNIIDIMTKMWTNFAKFGDPMPERLELFQKVVWEPVKKDGSAFYYMNISSEMRLESRPFKERMAFWDLFSKNVGFLQREYNAKHNLEHT